MQVERENNIAGKNGMVMGGEILIKVIGMDCHDERGTNLYL